MAKINFPKNASNFDAWFTNFQKAFNAHAREFGFTATDIKNVNQFFKTWRTSFTSYNEFNQFEKAFETFFNAQFALFQGFVQNYWNQIVANPNFNGNAQAWFGPSAPKKVATPARSKKTTGRSTTSRTTTGRSTTGRTTSTTRNRPTTSTKSTARPSTSKTTVNKSRTNSTRTSTSKATPIAKTTARKTTARKTTVSKTTVSKTTAKRTNVRNVNNNGIKTTILTNNGTPVPNNAPFVWFSSNKSGSVNVYVGGTKNGSFHLPTGATAAMVQYRYGKVSWRKLNQGSNVPFNHNLTGIDANKVIYRACWIFGNKKGPWSATSHFSISTTKAA